MEYISVFDVFKIGVGPSSSHTLGPWKAARQFVHTLPSLEFDCNDASIHVQLFGSLSLTGKGHATDLAIMMGLCDYNPETVETAKINSYIERLHDEKVIHSVKDKFIHFDPSKDIIFEKEFLEFHANGMIFTLITKDESVFSQTYYSLGGGFIQLEGQSVSGSSQEMVHPFPIQVSTDLLQYCREEQCSISEIVLRNELIDRNKSEIYAGVLRIWETMLDSIYLGCNTAGYLPGNLKVKRRAAEVTQKLIGTMEHADVQDWVAKVKNSTPNFHDIMRWVSSFAIAVNEVNASFGRVVTAPTNGSAGVIPAVLMYYLSFVNKEATEDDIVRFLLTAGEIGSIFKKGSTISAAMGGCQAEIGVSSAMAAAGLTELLGGSPAQCAIAAEVAMEHHLGMTCDPIGGLVQIPCIERNSMGAIKAINAATIALDRNPEDIKVPLDNVITTMWETAKDMNRKYKETSEGGLATAVNIIDC